MNKPHYNRFYKATLTIKAHVSATRKGKAALVPFDSGSTRFDLAPIPKSEKVIRVPYATSDRDIWSAYARAFKQAEEAGWGDNYLVRGETHGIVLRKIKTSK
jgi:hypothetical protein